MRSCVIAALLGVQLCVGAADAQIITTRNDGDKTITCTRIAPSSDLEIAARALTGTTTFLSVPFPSPPRTPAKSGC